MKKSLLILTSILSLGLSLGTTKALAATTYSRPFTITTDCLGYKFTPDSSIPRTFYKVIYGGEPGIQYSWDMYSNLTKTVGYLRVNFLVNGPRSWTLYSAYKPSSCQ